jgi:uncharacterized DUF497 family protein
MCEIHYLYSNLEKHGLYAEEVEEAFSDPSAVIIGGRSPVVIVLGRTLSGRLLEIGYKPNDDGLSLFVFHAMPARSAQRVLYERGNP